MNVAVLCYAWKSLKNIQEPPFEIVASFQPLFINISRFHDTLYSLRLAIIFNIIQSLLNSTHAKGNFH